jgi:DNA-binding transcriptional ArsR family regulator
VPHRRNDHTLLANVHHIASDGWSMGVLVRESAALYQAFLLGLPSPLPELPIQYPDFALWQRRWLSGPVLQAQLDFWRRELAGAPALLELPTDRPRPAVQSYRGATTAVSLASEATAAVHTLALRVGATPFMVLLAAFQVLLHRWSGTDDVLVGSPIANRGRLEVARAIATEPRTAGEIAALWHVDPTLVNRHLRALAAAGLATTVRRGRYVQYRLDTSAIERLGSDLVRLLLR